MENNHVKTRSFIFIVSAAFVFYGCNELPTEIGADFFNEGSFNFSYVDSMTIRLSTMVIDSMPTHDIDRVLIGHHNDEKLGNINAEGYYQFGLNNPFSLTKASVSYDYLAVALSYDGYHYYDTSSLHRFNVYRVTETMELNNEYLFNTSRFAHGKVSLGTLIFYPHPTSSDAVEIKLSDQLGREIFNMITDEDTEVSTNADFLKYLKGLIIASDTAINGSILGFTTTPQLRLYYADKSQVPPVQGYLSFEVLTTQGNIHFSSIHSDRSRTKLNKLVARENSLSSIETDGQSYLQAGIGLCMRVEFPYLKDLRQFNNVFTSQALLEIRPVEKSFDTSTPLPDSLLVYKVDKENTVYGQLTSSGTLVPDLYLGRDTHYSVDVTEFVTEQLSLEENNENGLMIALDDAKFRSRMHQIYAEEVRLKIYYSIIIQ